MNKERALEAALNYLGEQYRGKLEIIDGVDKYAKNCLYWIPQSCWSAYVFNDPPSIGATRIICISKKTYTVCYDGMVGE